MPGTMSIHQFLSEAHVPYAVLPHRPAFSAQQEAAATHVRGRDWAKVVVCIVDDKPIEAVLPAPYMVNLDDLLALTGGKKIRLAREDEVGRLFLDCEPGAMPPLGSIYGQMVYVDVRLAAEPVLVFDAGTHSEAIAMRWVDFVRTIHPVVGKFAEPRAMLDGGAADFFTTRV